MTWRTFEISVEGFDPFTLAAPSRSKARYEAWQRYREPYPDITFGEFARRCRVRGCDVPARDGYDYVRRNYGVDVRPGVRVRLQNEGPRFNGREESVIYPGQSTAHVHLVLDGEKHVSRVHPLNVVPLSAAT